MQSLSTAMRQAIANSSALSSRPYVTAEWNHNIHSPITTISNIGTDGGEDDTLFPIDSLVKANRPGAGLPKARVGHARLYALSDPIHYRTVDANSIYKYWAAAYPSAATPTSGSYPIDSGNTVIPAVIYTNSVKANKIRVTFENSWTKPVNYTIRTTVDGTTWVTVGTNVTIPSNGVVDLYLQNNGTWSSTVNLANYTPLKGVSVSITSIDKASSQVEVIELGLRLQRDLSGDCISFSVNKSMSEDDRISPVGVISANQASVSLDNTSNQYGQLNSTGLYYGLLNTNVEFVFGYSIDTSAFGGITNEIVKQGTFYVDTWGDDMAAAVDVSLSDYSKFLQAQNCLPVAQKNRNVWEVFAQVLEGVGFSRYVINNDNANTESRIPFVWFDGSQTVWAVIQDLCRATQSVAYFDESNSLIFCTRNYLFNNTTLRWTFNATSPDGTQKPDIIDMQDSFNIQANKVTINYTPTTLSESANKPVTNILWEPDVDEVQSCVLTQDLTIGETNTIHIGIKPSQTFPYTGYVNIEGEIIKYDGKTYKTRVGGTVTYTVCHSADDKSAADDASDAATYSANTFNGTLKNLTRGEFGTDPKAHTINITGWTGVKVSGGTATSASSHFSAAAQPSNMKIVGPGNANRNKDSYLAYRGTATDSYHVFGTQLRFSKDTPQGSGGLFFNLGSDFKTGYFVELNTTNVYNKELASAAKFISGEEYALRAIRRSDHPNSTAAKETEAAIEKVIRGKKASIYYEVRIYRKLIDGSISYLTGSPKGIKMAITPGIWYQIDVTQNGNDFEVFINGNSIAAFTDAFALTQGRAGMFVNGPTKCDFEYFYAVKNPENQKVGDSKFMDLVQGDFNQSYFDREVLFNWRYNKHGKKVGKDIQWIFDDFGPYVHEMKEYKVRFTKVPAWSSDIEVQNEMAMAINYRGGPFGAHFYIVAKSRNSFGTGEGTVILEGDDDSISPDNPISRHMFVYGMTINQGEQKTITIDNKYYENQQGVEELTFESPWIQSESMAKSLGNWIKAHFSTPCDIKTLDNFMHPGIQVTDLVSVNWASRGYLTANNTYHITAISLGWENGPTSNCTIRRAVL